MAWWIAPCLVTPFYVLTGAPASIRVHQAVCAAVAAPVASLIAITWSKLLRVTVLVLRGHAPRAQPLTAAVTSARRRPRYRRSASLPASEIACS